MRRMPEETSCPGAELAYDDFLMQAVLVSKSFTLRAGQELVDIRIDRYPLQF